MSKRWHRETLQKWRNFSPKTPCFRNPAGVLKGRTAIQNYREGGIKAGVPKEDISIAGAQKTGDVIYDYGDTTLHIDSKSGPKDIKLHSGNDWKIALLTATPVPPPKSQ